MTITEIVLAAMANYRPAIELMRTTLALLEDDMVYERFGLPRLPSVEARQTLAWCHAWQGEFAAAILLSEEAARIAEAVDHPESIVLAYQCGGLVYLLKGDLDEAIPQLERSNAFYRARHAPNPAPLSLPRPCVCSRRPYG